jgi:hypothetical protein
LAAGLAAFTLSLVAGFLAEALAAVRAGFGAGFLADVLLDCGDVFLEFSLEDFLRVILDIRLPFVAFRGSTIGVLRVLPVAVGFGPAAGQV